MNDKQKLIQEIEDLNDKLTEKGFEWHIEQARKDERQRFKQIFDEIGNMKGNQNCKDCISNWLKFQKLKEMIE